MSAEPTRLTPNQKLISGDSVEVSGIYRVEHWGEHVASREAVLIKGKILPACPECGTVTFRLVRAAPSPGEDADS